MARAFTIFDSCDMKLVAFRATLYDSFIFVGNIVDSELHVCRRMLFAKTFQIYRLSKGLKENRFRCIQIKYQMRFISKYSNGNISTEVQCFSSFKIYFLLIIICSHIKLKISRMKRMKRNTKNKNVNTKSFK